MERVRVGLSSVKVKNIFEKFQIADRGSRHNLLFFYNKIAMLKIT